MLVGTRMTYPVITVGPRTSLESALDLIHKESIHSLPVVDRQTRLLGIISIEKIESILHEKQKVQTPENILYVEDYMDRDVLTVTENTPIEEAARIISDYNVRMLPVLRGSFVVGIITETTIFRIFLELTGARSQGVRVTFLVEDKPGRFLQILQKIADLNGNVETFYTYCADEKGYKMYTLKISGIDKYTLKQAITPLASNLTDIR